MRVVVYSSSEWSELLAESSNKDLEFLVIIIRYLPTRQVGRKVGRYLDTTPRRGSRTALLRSGRAV
jgi:hypothetical protein